MSFEWLLFIPAGIFLWFMYNRLYKELKDIEDEDGPSEYPILTFTTTIVNHTPEGKKLNRPWAVGFTIVQQKNGQRKVIFTGNRAQEYFTSKSADYVRYGVYLLHGGDIKKIPKTKVEDAELIIH